MQVQAFIKTSKGIVDACQINFIHIGSVVEPSIDPEKEVMFARVYLTGDSTTWFLLYHKEAEEFLKYFPVIGDISRAND